jgi:glucosamine--fructose-6-phosphate aminotransferase (isomerizing)
VLRTSDDRENFYSFWVFQHHSHKKIVSNIQVVKARGGKVIALVTEGNEPVSKLADHTIELPTVSEYLSPLLTLIHLQLLTYQIAVLRDCNVD